MYVSVCVGCAHTQRHVLQGRGAGINRNAQGQDFMAATTVIREPAVMRLSNSRMGRLPTAINTHHAAQAAGQAPINTHHAAQAAGQAPHTTQDIHVGLLRVARFRASNPQAEDLAQPGRVRIIGGELTRFLADLTLAHPLLALLIAEGNVHACMSLIICYPPHRLNCRPRRFRLRRLLWPL